MIRWFSLFALSLVLLSMTPTATAALKPGTMTINAVASAAPSSAAGSDLCLGTPGATSGSSASSPGDEATIPENPTFDSGRSPLVVENLPC